MHARLVIVLLVAAVLLPPLTAQMRGPAGMGNFSSGHGSRGGFAHLHATQAFRPRTAFAIPYFYSDYFPEPDVIQAPSAQIVLVPTAPPAVEVPAAPPRALLIEWQGDHYARITSVEGDGIHGQPVPPDYAVESNSRSAVTARSGPVQRARDLPPAVLLFRDGRKEEVSNYTIVGTVMYSSADYWSSGSWNKKIELADLDVPGTLRLNQERGVKFVLPSAANEVITRP
jgi:hypothetical protein